FAPEHREVPREPLRVGERAVVWIAEGAGDGKSVDTERLQPTAADLHIARAGVHPARQDKTSVQREHRGLHGIMAAMKLGCVREGVEMEGRRSSNVDT